MRANRIQCSEQTNQHLVKTHLPDLVRVPFQAAMAESHIRAGDDRLDQTPPPLVAGSLQLLGVGHRQETVAQATYEDALLGWEGNLCSGGGRAGFKRHKGGERRVLEESALKRSIRGERRRWRSHDLLG